MLRIIQPSIVDGRRMFIIAAIGVAVNLVLGSVLHGHSHAHAHGTDHAISVVTSSNEHGHAHAGHERGEIDEKGSCTIPI